MGRTAERRGYGIDNGAFQSQSCRPFKKLIEELMSIHRDISALLNNPALCSALLRRLEASLKREFSATNPFRFMEVCGTHTVSLFRSGLASLLPPNIMHLSGPGVSGVRHA